MQQDRFKLNFQNFAFDLTFKTDYSLEMTATDVIDKRKFQNKSVEFKKIPKASILAALQEKNPNEIQCKISEQFEEKLMEKDQKVPLVTKKCLRIQFTVTLQYIQSFSESTILYQVDNPSNLNTLIPKKLSKQDIKQVKEQLIQIQAAIPTGDQSAQEMFQYHQVGTMQLKHDKVEQDKVIKVVVGYFVMTIFTWIFYIEFKHFFILLVVGVAATIWWFFSQKYLIKTIELKKGTYKINVTGMLAVQNYTPNVNDSFVLHFQFARWSLYKKIQLHVNCTNYYAYPFNGTMLIQSDKEQPIHIKIQKNATFYPVSLTNVVITVDKVAHFGSKKQKIK